MRRRDEHELRRVYEQHVDAVYAFFAYAVRKEAAEDLTASTFERVIGAWRRYDAARAGERTWILSIARNLLTDHYRRESHRRGASLDEHPGLLESLRSDEDWVQRRLDQDELRGWLSVLSEREREVLALRYGADLQAADIGRLLELSPANVHQIISRALRTLRERASAPSEPAPG
jgi:RNA polymerase sigma factor (sigma-70 family)